MLRIYYSALYIFTLTLFLTFFCFQSGISQAAMEGSRAIKVKLKSSEGVEEADVPLYQGSYALLVGVSKYSAGWPMLESIPAEVDKVEGLLTERGFKVVKVIDPDGVRLKQSFRSFINRYGFQKENRLLFFFSGHGFTRDNGKKGYLVPTDAPDPSSDLTTFLQKSLGMNQVLSWARDVEAKHALFLFDSCFSGTIFKQKARIAPPRHITRLTVEPVRQFITAGSAGEEVPANSTFTPAFIDALRFGLADLNKDGYVSATELGLYLQTEVPAHADQNPQFGKIRDYDLSRGDFIFMTDVTLGADTPSSQDKVPYSTKQKLGILKISSQPVGAAVYVDNRYQGNTPITLDDVAPGPRVIRVVKNDYVEETKKIHVSSGRHVTIDFPLVAAVSQKGTLTVSTIPFGTKVEIVGYSAAYRGGMTIPAGYYTLKASKHGFTTETMQVEISPREDFYISITLKRSPQVASPDNQEVAYSTSSSEPQNQQYYAPPPEHPPRVISPESTKVTYSRERSIPDEYRELINNVRSSNSKVKRNAAKTIYKKKVKHPVVYGVVEEELLAGYRIKQRDKNHIDAMAWLCNILGATKDSRYRATLKKVSSLRTNRKLQRYAAKNLKRVK